MLLLECAPETRPERSYFHKLHFSAVPGHTKLPRDRPRLGAPGGRAVCPLVEQAAGCPQAGQSRPGSPRGAHLGGPPWGLLVLVLPELDLMRNCSDSSICPFDELGNETIWTRVSARGVCKGGQDFCNRLMFCFSFFLLGIRECGLQPGAE